MSLLEQLDQDLKAAILAQDDVRKRTVRSVKAACSNALVEKRADAGLDTSLTDDEVLKVIAKQANQRRELDCRVQQGRPNGPGRAGARRAGGADDLPAPTARPKRNRGHRASGHRRNRRKRSCRSGTRDAFRHAAPPGQSRRQDRERNRAARCSARQSDIRPPSEQCPPYLLQVLLRRSSDCPRACHGAIA